MSRREMREQVFKLLFRVEFNDEDAMQQQKELFFEDGTVAVSEDDDITVADNIKAEITEKYEKIAEKITQIDEMINEKTVAIAEKAISPTIVASDILRKSFIFTVF